METLDLIKFCKGKKDLEKALAANDLEGISNIIKKKYVPKGKEYAGIYGTTHGYVVYFS